jgi:hypothetical protein
LLFYSLAEEHVTLLFLHTQCVRLIQLQHEFAPQKYFIIHQVIKGEAARKPSRGGDLSDLALQFEGQLKLSVSNATDIVADDVKSDAASGDNRGVVKITTKDLADLNPETTG